MTSGNGVERLSVKTIETWLKSPGRKAGQKLADGGGLYLTSLPSGGATWQVRYSHGGVIRTFSVGPHDEVSLSTARKTRRDVRDQVKEGLDAVTERRAKRAEGAAASGVTFQTVAEAWLAKRKTDWSEVHHTKSQRALERDVYPTLGRLPISRISTAMVAGVIDKIQRRGVRETAGKVLQHVRSVFKFAQASGHRLDNPAEPVLEILDSSPDVVHHPALLAFAELGDVLRRAETANMTPAVRLAHRLIAFTGVRISNAVQARWEHFDLDAEMPIWTIPREEMKVTKDRSEPHRVLLPPQIVTELKRWRNAVPKDAVYLFAGNQGRDHISREAIEKALRETLGLAGKHSPHGWRSAFSTRAREDTDFDRELIDLTLDHVHASAVSTAYDRGQRLHKRVELMKWWGNSLSQAERGAEVVPISRASREAGATA